MAVAKQANAFALYIHWPFCRARCPYCAFNVHVRPDAVAADYVEGLIKELKGVARRLGPRPLTTIFFGGGTPSLIPPAHLGALIDCAAGLFCLPSGADASLPEITREITREITMEMNPEDASPDYLRDAKQAGVNRLSIGVQAFDDADLAYLGRRHSAVQARQALDRARGVFGRCSLDLMYGWQGHTPARWQTSLNQAVKTGFGHISAYQLGIEPGSPWYRKRRTLHLPTEESIVAMDRLAHTTLRAAGYRNYEISNYAQKDHHCAHNLWTWHGGDYAGIGPGAAGRLTIDGIRYSTKTIHAPAAWLAQVREKGHGYDRWEALSGAQESLEQLMLRLRLREGVPAGLIDRWQAVTHSSRWREMAADGFLRQRGGRWFTTRKGRACLDGLTGALVKA
ncbi:MAG: radical SAM family heme chaperone HemW [Pseudomonadota bacterium]